MKWSQKRDLPPYDGDKSLVCVSGPVCARQASKLKPHVAIEFNKLSSPSRGVTATSWRLNSLCDHDTFAFDYYQDLLVLVERSVHSFRESNYLILVCVVVHLAGTK